MKTSGRVWAAGFLALSLSVCGVASADIPPPPTRPAWHEHPPPEPDVPDELMWALGALSVVAVGGAVVAYVRRHSSEPARA